MSKLEVMEAAHQRAQCIAQSWLRAWNVPFEVNGANLDVDGKKVAFGSQEWHGADADVVLSVKNILARDYEKATGEIKRLMEVVGRSVPEPLRQPSGKKATDYLGRSMRLTQFSQTANPSQEDMKPFLAIVKREADRASRRFGVLTSKMNMSKRDYYSIGLVFLTIYLHRYQYLGDIDRNKKNLTRFLQQEFGRWARVTSKDVRSIALDARGAMIEQFMSAPVPGSTINWWTVHEENGESTPEPSYMPPEYFEEEPDAPQSNPAEAKARLTKALAEMPHDKMVAALQDVTKSNYLDEEAKHLALVKLRRHARGCDICRATVE